MDGRELTPQERWAHRQRMKGKCTRCARKRNRYRWLCDACQKNASAYMKRWRAAMKEAREAKKRALTGDIREG